MILGGTVFTGWDIVLILLLYVGLPLLALITLMSAWSCSCAAISRTKRKLDIPMGEAVG